MFWVGGLDRGGSGAKMPVNSHQIGQISTFAAWVVHIFHRDKNKP